MSSAVEIRLLDSKDHGANMGLTWVLSVRDGPHFGPINLAVWDCLYNRISYIGKITFLNSNSALRVTDTQMQASSGDNCRQNLNVKHEAIFISKNMSYLQHIKTIE